jgi:hypothetical protein
MIWAHMGSIYIYIYLFIYLKKKKTHWGLIFKEIFEGFLLLWAPLQ